jgi:hypothetical protein
MGIGGAALAAGLTAAAPGVMQAGQNYAAGTQAQKAANAGMAGANAQIENDPTMQAIQNGTGGADMTDPNHPVWGVLGAVTGAPGAPALPTMASATQLPPGFQNGGVVRANNFGSKTIRPSFNRGPALPTGPNNTVVPSAMQTPEQYQHGGMVHAGGMRMNAQPARALPMAPHSPLPQAGITPASTEGQVLTMDQGGEVPAGAYGSNVSGGQGYQQMAGVPQPAVSGPAAGFVAGFQGGMNIGHNLKQQWDENNAKNQTAATDYAAAHFGDHDSNGNPISPTYQPSAVDDPVGYAKNKVEGFFDFLHSKTLDFGSHKPNAAQGVPAPSAATTPGEQQGPPIPTAAGGPAPAAPTPGAPSPVAPAGAASSAPPPQAATATPPASPAAPPASTGAGGTPAPAGAGAPTPAATAPLPPAASGQNSGGSVPLPVQGAMSADAAQTALKDPAVQAGTPDKTPAQSGLAHSLTPEDWQKMNELKSKAIAAAVQAGEDPVKVSQSIDAIQTAHFQGQVLRQYGAANQALLRGDMPAVKQALANVNYYLPNGQDIKFKNSTADDVKSGAATAPGQIMALNPFYGMYGHEQDQQYMAVTPQNLHQWATSALDPVGFGSALNQSYVSQMEARAKSVSAQGELLRGKGIDETGQANISKANNAQAMLPIEAQLKQTQGAMNLAHAGLYNREPNASAKGNGRPSVSAAALRAAQNDAIKQTNDNFIGTPGQQPATIPDPISGQPMPNPRAGTPTLDTTRVNPRFQLNGKPFSPQDQQAISSMAGIIAANNVDNPAMSKMEASNLATQIRQYSLAAKGNPSGGTHKGPDGKNYPNIVTHNGVSAVWMDGSYHSFHTDGPPIADAAGAAPGATVASNGDDGASPAGESGGGGGGDYDIPNAAS